MRLCILLYVLIISNQSDFLLTPNSKLPSPHEAGIHDSFLPLPLSLSIYVSLPIPPFLFLSLSLFIYLTKRDTELRYKKVKVLSILVFLNLYLPLLTYISLCLVIDFIWRSLVKALSRSTIIVPAQVDKNACRKS